MSSAPPLADDPDRRRERETRFERWTGKPAAPDTDDDAKLAGYDRSAGTIPRLGTNSTPDVQKNATGPDGAGGRST